MLSDVATVLLFLSGLISLYAIVCYLFGLRKKRFDFVLAGFRGALSASSLITICALILFTLLVMKDFTNAYVAAYTNHDLPFPFAISAFWAGQNGSLFFWLWVFSMITLFVASKRKKDELTSYAAVVLLLVQLFFIAIVLSLGNPFNRLALAPDEGSGLNPLLRNIYMISHPPFIFVAYSGFTVPFAFAIASLVRKDTSPEWIMRSRAWLLVSWLCLGIGIILGAKWAYVVLGWGGYWAWDPVENAALIPWLVATPLIHSTIMEERKGVLRLCNKLLILLVFELCIFGTFITRSGILSSVHAFAESSIGIYFLLFIMLSSFLYLLLLFIRIHYQKGKRSLGTLFSKEGFFLVNNLIFIAGAVIVLFGTIFPIISGVFTRKITLGSLFFNQALSPLALLLLFLTGLCTLVPWKRATRKNLLTKFACAFIASLAVLIGLFLYGIGNGWALITFFLAAFIIVSVLIEFMKKRNPLRDRRRLGSALAHIGIALISIGIIGSTILRQESKTVLSRGDSTTIGPFSIRYQEMKQSGTTKAHKQAAVLAIGRNGREMGTLAPARIYYPGIEEPYSEIAVHSSVIEDLYVILATITREEAISLHIYRNPLIFWIWCGSVLFFFGTFIAMLHTAKHRTSSSREDDIERMISEERRRRKIDKET